MDLGKWKVEYWYPAILKVETPMWWCDLQDTWSSSVMGQIQYWKFYTWKLQVQSFFSHVSINCSWWFTDLAHTECFCSWSKLKQLSLKFIGFGFCPFRVPVQKPWNELRLLELKPFAVIWSSSFPGLCHLFLFNARYSPNKDQWGVGTAGNIRSWCFAV